MSPAELAQLENYAEKWERYALWEESDAASTFRLCARDLRAFIEEQTNA